MSRLNIQRLIDMDLFSYIFPLFESMSRLGQETTVETLIMYLLKEE